MLIVSSMQKNKAAVSGWLLRESAIDNGISPSISDFYEPQFIIALKYRLSAGCILREASRSVWRRWLLNGRSLLYTAFNGEQLRLCPLGVISTKQRSVIPWALNISPQGVIHSGRAADNVSIAHSSDGLSSNVPQLCHFQFNMQKGLKGMLNGTVIEGTAFPDFPHPSTAGHLNLGACNGSYPTSKFTDRRGMSTHSAYCRFNIY